MNVKYSIRGNIVHFIVKDENEETVQSGMFTEEYNGPERQAYLDWVAEGNTAEEAE
jgi:hypothetical protein